jgi:serine/threonine protein kinase
VSEAEQDVFRRRALAEARSAARLTHPNAVTLFDVIPATPADDAVYLIMEYVDGATLGQVIEREGPLSEPRAAGIALQMLSILNAAHALGWPRSRPCRPRRSCHNCWHWPQAGRHPR